MGWAIALHGGAGDISRSVSADRWTVRETALRECLEIGVQALQSSKNPLAVVELVVRELENHPCFNAGKGSVLTSEGTVEMEACIMDGKTKNCGSVSGLTSVVNPISVARLVMENTPHVYLGFKAAEDFAKDQGVELAEPTYFITEENIERLRRAKSAKGVHLDYTEQSAGEEGNTVGCVAVDEKGNLAAATSTGGLVNKMGGRIGDTPIVGSGTYANEICAVSATGKGESIIRHTVARDVAAVMQYKSLPLSEAAQSVINGCPRGDVGIIAVSSNGDVATPFNTTGMFRAYASQNGPSVVAIF